MTSTSQVLDAAPRAHHGVKVAVADPAVVVRVELAKDELHGMARQLRCGPSDGVLEVSQADVALGAVVEGSKRSANDLVWLLHGGLAGKEVADLGERNDARRRADA